MEYISEGYTAEVKPFMHILELLQQWPGTEISSTPAVWQILDPGIGQHGSTWQPLRLQVDIAFSYYDGTRGVPWGSTDEVAFTNNLDCKRILLSFCRGLLNKWIRGSSSWVGTCWDLVGSLRMRSTRFLHATSCHSGGYWDRFSLGFLSSYLKERLRAFARGSADHAKQHRCDPMVCNLGHWGTQDFVLLFISFCGHVFPI